LPRKFRKAPRPDFGDSGEKGGGKRSPSFRIKKKEKRQRGRPQVPVGPQKGLLEREGVQLG